MVLLSHNQTAVLPDLLNLASCLADSPPIKFLKVRILVSDIDPTLITDIDTTLTVLSDRIKFPSQLNSISPDARYFAGLHIAVEPKNVDRGS